ncbi:ribosomal protein S18-alanine N-acetyltransferase [Bacillus kwashiorkori]|uniref:ribosomal protein S18-alanine N-acetyltransferase n=1 Tax=Bacillus kwashiorkori TaxID=1522318 RepID=UPI000780628D|nr:ribosomal protein S18-alanine N-acetyltransferase [Bacillus kwashiorkori]
METKLVFRRITINDIDALMNIEHASFTLPWSKDAFVRELTMNPYAYYIGIEMENKLIAYAGVWLIVDEAHITNIAVLPEYRGKKLGEQLLSYLLNLIKAKGAKSATLEVRVSNVVAQNLYRKYGFLNGGIRKGYYTDNYEDALVMWVKL